MGTSAEPGAWVLLIPALLFRACVTLGKSTSLYLSFLINKTEIIIIPIS